MSKVGAGLLFVGACSACWIVPLLVGLLGAGWLGAFGASWPWMIGAAVLAALAVLIARRVQRRRRPGCACPPSA